MNTYGTMKKYFLPVFLILSSVHGLIAQTNFSISGLRCINSTLQFTDLTDNNPTSWSWEFGDGQVSTEQNPSHAYTNPGNYTVQLTSTGNGLNTSRELQITIFEPPRAGFTIDSIVFTSYARTFTDTSVASFAPLAYIWKFDDNNSESTDGPQVYYKFSSSGTFSVMLKITDRNGCADSVRQTVNIFDRFYVPNIFTPNNDGINDLFLVSSNGITRFSIEIYNRWGNRVFMRNDMEQIVWDGYNPEGTMVTPGTYFYVITPGDTENTYQPLNGFITIFY